jgi:hypothetical protein
VQSLDASEGGSTSSPLLLGNSPFVEPQIIDLKEITRGGRRYLVCTCCRAPATQTVQGHTGAFSGRTLIILDVEDPTNISVVSVYGPPLSGSLVERSDPPYESYSSVVIGDTIITACYGLGLLLTDASNLTQLTPISQAILSGESRWLVRRGDLMVLGDAISTLRFYDIGTDPQNPIFLDNYYSQGQIFKDGVSLPPTAIGYCFCAGVTSNVLEIVRTDTFALAATFTLPFSIYGMDYDQGGAARLVVWGFVGSNPAWALLDISNPLAPVILMQRLSDANGDVRCRKCILIGDRLIFSSWGALTSSTATGGGFIVYDISTNPPIILASIRNSLSVNAPVQVADMVLLTSGTRRFLLTVPYWDSTPTDIIKSNGGIWVYEVTDWANPVSMARDGYGNLVDGPVMTHTTLVGLNQPCIFSGLYILLGLLFAGDYYQATEVLDVNNVAVVSVVSRGAYSPGTRFTFCVLGNGFDLYFLTISDLHIEHSALEPRPPAPDPGPSLFNWTVTAVAPDQDEALIGGWWEVRDPIDTTRFSIVTDEGVLNLEGGSYGAYPPWPGSPPLPRCAVRFHDGKTPDRAETEIINLDDLLSRVQVET